MSRRSPYRIELTPDERAELERRARRQWRSLAELETTLHAFADHYSAIAEPFEWRFTRVDLTASWPP